VTGHNGCPITFQDLTIEYEITDGAGGLGTAISITNSESYNLFRVNIINCEMPVNLVNIDYVVMLQCTISYNDYPSAQNCWGIQVQGAEVDIGQCVLTYQGTSSATSCIGILVEESTFSRVADSTISGFSTGIEINSSSGVAKQPTFHDLRVDAQTSCVVMQSSVYDATFVNCHFRPTTSSPGGSGIVLQASSNAKLDTIMFTGCTVAGYTNGFYGLQIVAGQNIQINGGDYSGNGTAGIAITGSATEIQITGANCLGPSYAGATTPTTQQYGIYIAGGQDIQIAGVNCSGNGTSGSGGAGIYITGSTEEAVSNVRIVGAICGGAALGGSAVQEYGIYVNDASAIAIDASALTGNLGYGAYLSSVTNATISSCDLYSSASGAIGVYVAGSSTLHSNEVFVRGCNGAEFASPSAVLTVGIYVDTLEVSECSGYNDRATILTTSVPATMPFSGITVAGYYGPTAFYVVGNPLTSSVLIDTHNTILSSGGFTLAAGETAQISGGGVSHFLMVGK
jgi:hypothetical protein